MSDSIAQEVTALLFFVLRQYLYLSCVDVDSHYYPKYTTVR